MDVVALRYSNVYGPRQDPHGEAGVVAIFCDRILRGEALTVFGDGGQTRDYVFAGDVARANFAAATIPLPTAAELDVRAYNIGPGVQTTVLALAETLQRVASREVPVRHAQARPGEQLRSAVNIEKASRDLAWVPQVSLEQGLLETYEFFKARMAQ
jgi:UDP-glucose 4-epimerase